MCALISVKRPADWAQGGSAAKDHAASGRGSLGRAGGQTLRLLPACRRDLRERLYRYIAHPAVAEKRITVTAQGKVVYLLKTPYRNGTTHVVFELFDFIGVEPVDPINSYFRFRSIAVVNLLIMKFPDRRHWRLTSRLYFWRG